jgi:DNA-directed RNA polymerase specialized sigma24 family protein
MRLRANRHRPMSVELGPTAEHEGETTLLNLLPVEDLQLSGTIDRIAIGRALGKLPTGYRRVFLLHDVEGLAHSEIARNLGCTIGTSKSQLHQARLQLRHFLRRPAFIRRHRQAKASAPNLGPRKLSTGALVSNVPWVPVIPVPVQAMAHA